MQCLHVVVKVFEIFKPSSPYVTDLESERGERCQSLIPKFFNLMVKSWVLSTYMEDAMWTTIDYDVTTACESYFHAESMFIPKSQSIKGEQYTFRENVAFLAYHSKRSELISMSRKLCGHKYAPTLVASFHQKGGVHEGYILDTLAELYKDDWETMKNIELSNNKRDHLIKSRVDKQRQQKATIAEDKLSTILKMGPKETATGKFTHIDGLACNVQKIENKDCPRPVPPFPFKNTNYLVGEEPMQLLREVWSHSDTIRELVKQKCNQTSEQNDNNDKGKQENNSDDSDNDIDSGNDNDNDSDNDNDNDSDSDNDNDNENKMIRIKMITV